MQPFLPWPLHSTKGFLHAVLRTQMNIGCCQQQNKEGNQHLSCNLAKGWTNPRNKSAASGRRKQFVVLEKNNKKNREEIYCLQQN